MVLGADRCTLIRPRRANGATQTFRRSSTANNVNQRENAESGLGAMGSTAFQGGVQPSSHLASTFRNSSSVEGRYSKEQLLDLYQLQGVNGASSVNMNDLFLEWNPKTSNQITNGGWGKGDDQKYDVMGPDICWDHDGSSHPLGMVDMTEDEVEVGRTISAFSRSGLIFAGVQKLRELSNQASHAEYQ